MVCAQDVEKAITAGLTDARVQVTDISGGCGTSFEVAIVSSAFEGKRLLDRHKLVNAAIAGLMQDIHAFSIKRAWTPEQAAKAASTPA